MILYDIWYCMIWMYIHNDVWCRMIQNAHRGACWIWMKTLGHGGFPDILKQSTFLIPLFWSWGFLPPIYYTSPNQQKSDCWLGRLHELANNNHQPITKYTKLNSITLLGTNISPFQSQFWVDDFPNFPKVGHVNFLEGIFGHPTFKPPQGSLTPSFVPWRASVARSGWGWLGVTCRSLWITWKHPYTCLTIGVYTRMYIMNI